MAPIVTWYIGLTIWCLLIQNCHCSDIDVRFLVATTPAGAVWSTWSKWSDCSVTCSSGTRFRARHCEGGTTCQGEVYQSKQCTLQRCLHKIDGGWGIWSNWGACSTTCGDGLQSRFRLCDNPAPQDGGALCMGDNRERTFCKTKECPIDGGWSNYTIRPCSKTCGLGVAVSIRHCTNPVPQYGGKTCTGSTTKFAACKEADCVIDGQWSNWSNFTNCNVVCGDGHRRRYRECTAPFPQNGGKVCTGESMEMDDCNKGVCPTDIKTCNKQAVNSLLANSTDSQSVCTNRSQQLTQRRMITQYCNAPSDENKWKLGMAISSECEAVPVRAPIGLINRDTKERKYGILLDCYQQILEFVTETCTTGVSQQTINLTTSTTDYHLLLW